MKYFVLPLLIICAFASAQLNAALRKTEKQCEQIYGQATRVAGSGTLKGGGKHVFYKCDVRNIPLEVECLFIDNKCVGVSYLTPEGKEGGLIQLVANTLLAENGGLNNWQMVGKPLPGILDLVHRRFKDYASWSMQTSLVLWTAKGQAEAAKEPPAMVENTALGNTQSGTGSGMPTPREQGPSSGPLPKPCSRDLVKQSVKTGMSVEQVISILGTPDDTSDNGDLYIYYRNRTVDPFAKKIDSSIQLVFRDGKTLKSINF